MTNQLRRVQYACRCSIFEINLSEAIFRCIFDELYNISDHSIVIMVARPLGDFNTILIQSKMLSYWHKFEKDHVTINTDPFRAESLIRWIPNCNIEPENPKIDSWVVETLIAMRQFSRVCPDVESLLRCGEILDKIATFPASVAFFALLRLISLQFLQHL